MSERTQDALNGLFAGDNVAFKKAIDDELDHLANERIDALKPVVASRMFAQDNNETGTEGDDA